MAVELFIESQSKNYKKYYLFFLFNIFILQTRPIFLIIIYGLSIFFIIFNYVFLYIHYYALVLKPSSLYFFLKISYFSISPCFSAHQNNFNAILLQMNRDYCCKFF